MTKEEFKEYRIMCLFMGQEPLVTGYGIYFVTTETKDVSCDFSECISINLGELDITYGKLFIPEFIDSITRFCEVTGDTDEIQELHAEGLSYIAKGGFIQFTELERVYLSKETFVCDSAFNENVEIIYVD